MRKYLASVGNAQLLGKVKGELVHIADIRTLTESTLSFSTSMEEVRAGEGAQLYGRFSHDSGMTVTLTDAMFDMNYIGLQVGSFNEEVSGSGYISHSSIVEANNAVAVESQPVAIGNACGLTDTVVWYRKQGCGSDTEWKAIVNPTYTNGKITLSGTYASGDTVAIGDKVCLRYFTAKPESRCVEVKSNFFPAECVLILTTKLYAGDASAPESGKPWGEITVKIPRFQLDGQFDLNMAMSSPSTVSLNGTALATDSEGCDGRGVYAEIVEVRTGSTAVSGLKDIVVNPEHYSVVEDGTTYQAYDIYGFYEDGHTGKLGAITTNTSAFPTGNATTSGSGSIFNWKSGDGSNTTEFLRACFNSSTTPSKVYLNYWKNGATQGEWSSDMHDDF